MTPEPATGVRQRWWRRVEALGRMLELVVLLDQDMREHGLTYTVPAER